MTRDELLRALVIGRFATVTPPPPVRAAPDPDDWDRWADEPDDDPDTEIGDAGEWIGNRRVETVEIPGVNQLPPWDSDQEMGERGVKAAFTPRGGIR